MTIRDYDDVPGTYVLDSRNYRKGYHLNMFLMSLNKSEARAAFAADETGLSANLQIDRGATPGGFGSGIPANAATWGKCLLCF